MVSLDDAVIARIKKHGHTFELFVDPDLALALKYGEETELSELLAVENVFKDAKAGEKASDEAIQEAFGTTEFNAVATEVVKKGELHLTTEQRRVMLENRRRQVVDIISRNAVNPQTKTPHPPSRIEKAMEEAKVRVDLSKSAKTQVEEVLKAISPIIPIRFMKVDVAVQIPGEYSGKLYQILRDLGDVKKEEWRGSTQYVLIEIPGGLQDELYDKLNKTTHGNAEIKLVK